MNDKKFDPNYIFNMERNIKAYMLVTIMVLFVISLALSIALILLVPLKEKKPYLLYFNGADSNFVQVREGNEIIKGNTALLKNILAGYVQNREMINRINDNDRYELTRIQSSKQVWEGFSNLVNNQDSIYQKNGLYRDIKIINVALLSEEIATIDFTAEKYDKTRNYYEFEKYRASIKYIFKDEEDLHQSVIQNPTGFQVVDYSVTSITDFENMFKE